MVYNGYKVQENCHNFPHSFIWISSCAYIIIQMIHKKIKMFKYVFYRGKLKKEIIINLSLETFHRWNFLREKISQNLTTTIKRIVYANNITGLCKHPYKITHLFRYFAISTSCMIGWLAVILVYGGVVFLLTTRSTSSNCKMLYIMYMYVVCKSIIFTF